MFSYFYSETEMKTEKHGQENENGMRDIGNDTYNTCESTTNILDWN